MNGKAITKRYEVRDGDTGEPVRGAYVLIPEEDPYAETAMFAYAALCGLNPTSMRAVVQADPQSDHDRPFLAAIAEGIEPPPDGKAAACDSVDAESFVKQAYMGHGDGSIEHAYSLWRSIGYEPVSVVMRAVLEGVQEAAKRYLDAMGDAENARQSVEARRRDLAASRDVEAMGMVPTEQGDTDVVMG